MYRYTEGRYGYTFCRREIHLPANEQRGKQGLCARLEEYCRFNPSPLALGEPGRRKLKEDGGRIKEKRPRACIAQKKTVKCFTWSRPHKNNICCTPNSLK